MDNVAKLLADLREHRRLLDDAILAMQRISYGSVKKRGRPPAWLKQARKKGRGRPPGSRTAEKMEMSIAKSL